MLGEFEVFAALRALGLVGRLSRGAGSDTWMPTYGTFTRPSGYQNLPPSDIHDFHPDANFYSYLPNIVGSSLAYNRQSPTLQHFIQAGPSLEGLSGAPKLWGLKAGLPSHPNPNRSPQEIAAWKAMFHFKPAPKPEAAHNALKVEKRQRPAPSRSPVDDKRHRHYHP